MRTIVLYARRNVGLYALSYLKGCGFSVKVISDDKTVLWLSKSLGCEEVTLDTIGDFDLFLCVHGNKIIDSKYLEDKKFINIHPCIYRYKGSDPIRRYIENEDMYASVSSHFMTEKVDEGEIIYDVFFSTPVCKTYADFYNAAVRHYYFCFHMTLEKLNIKP